MFYFRSTLNPTKNSILITPTKNQVSII